MCASTSKFSPANLFLMGWMAFSWMAAGSDPLRAQPLAFEDSEFALAAWIDGFGRWFRQEQDAMPPHSGTCIDPNGKPKPCDPSKTVPGRAQREPERPPRV